jgi:hypothetical protein
LRQYPIIDINGSNLLAKRFGFTHLKTPAPPDGG